jgi:multidrug efflux pump subunit AcrB
MQRFNLSQWSITHRPRVLFVIILLGAAGIYSYLNLGRAEDPSFTIKTMIVHVGWPGATAAELQAQAVDKVEKKLQELPYLDRIESYSQPGGAFIRVTLSDKTPPAKVKDLWYRSARRSATSRTSYRRGSPVPISTTSTVMSIRRCICSRPTG